MTEPSLITDMVLAAATSGIILRSERQRELSVIEDTFVDTGIIAQISNRNSQIVYGRRGTGKSHVLRVLAARSQRNPTELAVYFDLRTLGSARLVTDSSRGTTVRSVSVFNDILSLVQHHLLEHSVNLDGRGLEAVSNFADSIRNVTSMITARETTDEWQSTQSKETGGGLRLSLKDVSAEGSSRDRREVTSRKVGRYNEVFESTVVFVEVTHHLNAALRALGVEHLVVLVDEWSSIPADIQPYIAEFIKRTMLPAALVTIKIGSLEHSSQFSTTTDTGGRIGFELGGDIFANLDLDDYYSYDRNSARVVDFFTELLYRHLVAEMPQGHLDRTYGFATSADLVSVLFAGPDVFAELVRAGEGVVRDFLGIYTHAFFHTMRSGGSVIAAATVRTAALEWFEIDKLPNLDQDLYRRYQQVVAEVAGQSHSPYFLLERSYAKDPTIRSLFDLRLIHLVKRGLAHETRPGMRYNLYALDFGSYATPAIGLAEDWAEPARALESPTAANTVILEPPGLDPGVGGW